jgi:cell division protein FtsQ
MTMQVEKLPVLRQRPIKQRSNKRALLLLSFFFFIVLIILFLRSPMSKISIIEVKGNDLLTVEQVIQASGLSYGASFFTWTKKDIIQQLTELAEVESVQMDSSFPGKVTVLVTEYNKVAFELTEDGDIVPLLENGKLLSNADYSSQVIDRPIIRQWKGDPSLKKTLSYELGQTKVSILQMLSEISPSPSDAYPDKIKIYTRDGYVIHTTVGDLSINLGYYQMFVSERVGQAPGVLNLLDAKYFRQYKSQEASNES